MIEFDSTYFKPKDVFECGQIFRYFVNQKGNYVVISKDNMAEIIELSDRVRLITTDDDYFYNFFDLKTNYGEIVKKLTKPIYGIEKQVQFGKGIRILKQQPFETLISFIISANNNIPRIKGIIARICEALGEKKDGYFAFPTPQKMADASIEFYQSIGTGYRAKYLSATAKAVAEGKDLQPIEQMDVEQASKYLISFMGVGQKVADCVLLFAYAKTKLFPVDTWIRKIYQVELGDNATDTQIRNYLIDKYGEYAGYAQQYVYYYHRTIGTTT